MTIRKLSATAFAALAATACATTTDPYACANQGIGSMVSGCQKDVRNETANRQKAVDAISAGNAEIQAQLAASRAVEASLQAEVASLKADIAKQTSEIGRLRSDLDRKRKQNAITQASYDKAMKELADGEAKLKSLAAASYNSRTQLAKDQGIVAEVARATARVREVTIG